MIINVLDFLIGFFGGDKVKVQVIMQDDFVKRLDARARKSGLSRSAYINTSMIAKVANDEAKEQAFERLLEGKDDK